MSSTISQGSKAIQLTIPVKDEDIRQLKVGDHIEVSGVIFCGRDAVLPKLVNLLESGAENELEVDLAGGLIFHTAVSPAGIGPTTSNKVEIEGSIPMLSKAGVKIHLGKGALNAETVAALKTENSVFAITPPTTALFTEKIIHQRVAMYPEEGMEALYEVEVTKLPAIVAIAHGETIY